MIISIIQRFISNDNSTERGIKTESVNEANNVLFIVQEMRSGRLPL